MALPNHSWKDPGRALKILCNKPQSPQAPAVLPLLSPPAEVCRHQELMEAVTVDWDSEQFHPNALERHPTPAHVPRGKRWGPNLPGPGPVGSYRSAVLQLTAIAAQFLRQRRVVPTVCVSGGEGSGQPSQGRTCQGEGSASLAPALPRSSRSGRRTREAASDTRLAPPPCSPTNLVGLHHPPAGRMDSSRAWSPDLSKRHLDQQQGPWSGENPHVEGAQTP